MQWASIILSAMLLFYLATMPGTLGAEKDNIRWQSYTAGIKIAEMQNLPVFLYFFADWCPYCVKMAKETFQEIQVIRFLNSNFVSIKVDFDKELELVEKYQVRGLPSSFVIDLQGKRLGPIQGYLSGKALLSRLNQIYKMKGGGISGTPAVAGVTSTIKKWHFNFNKQPALTLKEGSI